MKKNTYYVMEANLNSYRKAEKISATSLTSAKRTASRNRVFVGTELSIGLWVDDNGFVRDPLTIKTGDGPWEEPNLADGNWIW